MVRILLTHTALNVLLESEEETPKISFIIRFLDRKCHRHFLTGYRKDINGLNSKKDNIFDLVYDAS